MLGGLTAQTPLPARPIVCQDSQVFKTLCLFWSHHNGLRRTTHETMYPFTHPNHAQGSPPARSAQTRSPYSPQPSNASRAGRSSPLEPQARYTEQRSTRSNGNHSSNYNSLPSSRASPQRQFQTQHSNASASSFVSQAADYYAGSNGAMDSSPLIRGPNSTTYNNQAYDAQRQGYNQYDNYGPPPPNPYDSHSPSPSPNQPPASPAYNNNQLAPSYSNDGSYYNNDLTSYYSNDYDDKSYSSHTALNSSNSHIESSPKEFGVGQVVPTMSYTPPPPSPAPSYSYPPSPSPLPATPGFSGTSHWHKVRSNMMARRVVKKVPLTNGNFVIDVPVPKEVLRNSHQGIGAERGELEKMRYTAATCDPDDFMRCKFNLRPYLYGRRTELFVSYGGGRSSTKRASSRQSGDLRTLRRQRRARARARSFWLTAEICSSAD